jgi:broad-specificity NMP kinase
VIILEGPDGMGKSTLADRLTEPGTALPKLTPFVCQRRHVDGTSLMNTMVECHHRTFLHGVQDRVAQISEAVYGPIANRELISEHAFNHFHRRLIQLAQPVIIYCRVENLDDALPTREPDETLSQHNHVLRNLDRLRDAYDRLLFGRVFRDAHVITFDYTRDDPEDLIHGLPTLICLVAERQARAELKRSHDNTEALRLQLPTGYATYEL